MTCISAKLFLQHLHHIGSSISAKLPRSACERKPRILPLVCLHSHQHYVIQPFSNLPCINLYSHYLEARRVDSKNRRAHHTSSPITLGLGGEATCTAGDLYPMTHTSYRVPEIRRYMFLNHCSRRNLSTGYNSIPRAIIENNSLLHLVTLDSLILSN